ncbi:hypothetical protein BU23DRAFT_572792 [Bimuria novae-zelandiae CBS 107.79]|uniref:Uncharacterized protein n=1 Tax=Bimuria novae-zelandiae CBS 107.79 TaxID=1447943 RepID=A0A6A5UTF8_9PLEO|nr:hypothetical protein BU23DRAFT_572792 [Bimuria novae-zelandiae CBS 107.79]
MGLARSHIIPKLCYQFMFVELNGKELPRDPWSYRQTGIHHKASAINDSSEVVILHLNDNSVAQSRLEKYADSSRRVDLAKHPLKVHLYIEDLASDLEQIRKYIDIVKAGVGHSTLVVNPERLQTLRHIEDKLVCRPSRCLQSTRVIIHTLLIINSAVSDSVISLAGESFAIRQELQQFEQRLEGHINAVKILATRVQATLGLLTNLLDIENQVISNKINSRMLDLTRDNVDDNATSFLGMNLFDFRAEDRALIISPDFWIYVITTLPLTLLTVGAWYLYKGRQDRKRKRKYNDEDV